MGGEELVGISPLGCIQEKKKKKKESFRIFLKK